MGDAETPMVAQIYQHFCAHASAKQSDHQYDSRRFQPRV